MMKVNLDTLSPDAVLDGALAGINTDFRKRIINSYLEIKRRFTLAVYTDEAYDAIGLSAGKFCEALLRFLQHELTGTHIRFNTRIKNFADECRKIERLPKVSGVESLRIILPRCLLFVYTIRNKRGIGHTGGDIDANRTDITTTVYNVTWIVCELIRIYYKVTLEDAQGIVDTLNTRTRPEVWEVMGRKRVLKKGLNYQERTLLLCYTTPNDAVYVEDLFEWTEYSRLSDYRKKVIGVLHNKNMIEFDKETEAVFISPLGIEDVEKRILLKKDK